MSHLPQYMPNPKLSGSGILGAIPQTGTCRIGCADCFFASGRSFLEPLEEHLPNLPSPEKAHGYVVRMNDGNDSNYMRGDVITAAKRYADVFFNTCIPRFDFPGPVVLTVNPAKLTDVRAHLVNPCPPNLMFVRVRTHPGNLALVDRVVEHYTARKVPVVLTFLAYYSEPRPVGHEEKYEYRVRTLNPYWVLRDEEQRRILALYPCEWVYACGHSCARCGNCLREYFVTKERMHKDATT